MKIIKIVFFFRFAAQQELRSKREQELATLKKSLEEEAGTHEVHLTELRHKHSQELGALNEQLESLKKARASLEKAKQTLEAENADLATELRNVNSSRQENDRRRKQAESQIAELQVRLCARTAVFGGSFSISNLHFNFLLLPHERTIFGIQCM